jgi:hypothetical protein
MNDKLHKIILYVIIALVTISTFTIYTKWDTEKKVRAQIEQQYKADQTIAGIQQKNQALLEKTEQQNLVIVKKMESIDKKLASLYKEEAGIKPPTQEQLNEIKKDDAKAISNTFNKLGYSTTVTGQPTGLLQ